MIGYRLHFEPGTLSTIEVIRSGKLGKGSRQVDVLATAGGEAAVEGNTTCCVRPSNRAAVLGEQCGQWVQSAFDARGPESLRSIMELCNLSKKHSGAVLNAACAKALKAGTHRLKDVCRLIGEESEQSAFSFAQSHPPIRDLKTYSDFINHHSQYQNDD